MALTPQNNEAFFREVDDEVRREKLETTARRYGAMVVGLVAIGLVALGGALWWRAHEATIAGERGERLIAAMSSINANQEAQADKALAGLAGLGDTGYAPLARMLQADMMVKNGKAPEAAKAFLAIAGDASVPQPLRDVATMRATAIDFDTITPQVALARLKPLAVPGNPWFGSAGEMEGIAYLRMNQPRQAGALFLAITRDPGVPQSLRARVAQLAADLGYDPVQPSVSPAP